ncbi:hypothetical protein SBA4_1190018 [Candidatus Sulfopaludibacter sp. SbA4]|nr:hypothetical protein SBA4_1190018 [Candidatus Sulfopaludibacter sp. SbA4]
MSQTFANLSETIIATDVCQAHVLGRFNDSVVALGDGAFALTSTVLGSNNWKRL